MQKSLENILVVRLDIANRLSAEEQLRLASALVEHLRADPAFSGAAITIDGMGEGTWWIHLLIILGTAMAATGTLADRVPKLVDDIKAGQGPFGAMVASTLDQHGGSNCKVATDGAETIIRRDDIRLQPITGTAHGELRIEGTAIEPESAVQALQYSASNPIVATVVGAFAKDRNNAIWLKTGRDEIRIVSEIATPIGVEMVITGTVIDPPLFIVERARRLVNDEGELAITTEFLNDRRGFVHYGIDTSNWPKMP